MKTASVRQIRNHFPEVLRLVTAGETVAITSRRQIVANLTPPAQAMPARRAWADLPERIKAMEAQRPLKESGAQILAEDRDRY